MSISIIIVNFNYGRYVRQAIESSLAVVAPKKQIIIVDDGSTDDSRSIITEYRQQATIIFKKNEGQLSGYNRGFLASKGRWILFLDSDDFLFPSFFKECRPFLRRGVSKVQFQSKVVDHLGRFSGKIVPDFRFNTNPKNINKWNLTTGSYPSSWGTANLYSRYFLNKIFPLNGDLGKIGDTKPIILAPFCGKVETINKPLAAYRVHGENDSNKNFDKIYLLLEQRLKYKMQFAQMNFFQIPDHFPKRNIELIYKTICIKKIFPSIFPFFKCTSFDYFCSFFISQPFSIKKCLFYYFSSIVVHISSRGFIVKNKWFFYK